MIVFIRIFKSTFPVSSREIEGAVIIHGEMWWLSPSLADEEVEEYSSSYSVNGDASRANFRQGRNYWIFRTVTHQKTPFAPQCFRP